MAKAPSKASKDTEPRIASNKIAIMTVGIMSMLILAGIFISRNIGQPVSLKTTGPSPLETAQIYYDEGNHKQAIPLLEDYLAKAKPDDRNTSLVKDLLISSYWQTKNYQQAFALLSEVVKANPSDIDSIYRLGLLAAELGKDEQAAAYFSQAIAGQSGQPQYHTGYAGALTRLGKHQEAREQWQTVMSLTPADSRYRAALHGQIGDTYVAQNQRESARAEFKTGLEIEPDNQYLIDQLESLGP